MGDDASKIRQRIKRMGERFRLQVERLLKERGPLVRGSMGTRVRVCGKPNCRCTQGERHESKYLTATDGGKTRQVHVPARDEVDVARGVERYRRFQTVRAELADLTRFQFDMIDQLGRLLLKPYPPGNPLPPATRRGRRPKERKDRKR